MWSSFILLRARPQMERCVEGVLGYMSSRKEGIYSSRQDIFFCYLSQTYFRVCHFLSYYLVIVLLMLLLGVLIPIEFCSFTILFIVCFCLELGVNQKQSLYLTSKVVIWTAYTYSPRPHFVGIYYVCCCCCYCWLSGI